MSEPTHREVAVFNAALELRPAERAAYLDEACAGDAALRQQVEDLLRMDAAATGFLEAPPAGGGATRTVRLTAPLTEKPGDRIGHYKLLQQIGEGGCGVVYMAEQEEPVRRRVALKVIKLGMDTKHVVARFDAERQALALMDHPNIAKVLEGGATNTGRPYFVMELVRGTKITDFCDEQKLSTEDRLKLFIQVCQAVQHAHQKGIIHRDIKPSNILVTINDGVPVPKVIDFGIAKATQGRLTDQTLFTAFEQFIGTPAYMSPEQAVLTSLDIDTRSDIYSLGVLLYELLTGRTPFDQKELLDAGLDEMRRTIREEEPPKPSTRLGTMAAEALTTTAKLHRTDAPKLIHLLRGDLDWIVMKSLDKDRARRYETANGLAADIQRHLNNEPVNARPPSTLYRLQKSVHRNKTAFAAVMAIAGVLVIGIVTSTEEAIRATRAEREQIRLRQVAESKEKKSEQVAQFLKDMLSGVGPSVALGRDTTMLREIVDKTAERIGTDLKDQPEVEIELRLTLGNVYSSLQLYKKMAESAQETLRLAQTYKGRESLQVADAVNQLSDALLRLHVLDQAETFARQATVIQRKLRGDDSLQEAQALQTLGDVLRCQCESPGVLRDCQIDCVSTPGSKGKIREAEACYRKALAIQRKRLGEDDLGVAIMLDCLGGVLRIDDRLTEAEDVDLEALAIRRKLLPDEHTEMTRSFMWLGATLVAENKLQEAETYFRKAIPIQRRTQGQGKWYQAVSFYLLADTLQRQNKLDEAEDCFREALAIGRTQMGADHPDLPNLIMALANVLHQSGKLAEASPLSEEAIRLCREHPGQEGQLAYALAEFVPTLLDTGKFAKAELVARECLVIREKILPDDWQTFDTKSMLGDSLLWQEKYLESKVMLLSGYQGLKQMEEKIPRKSKCRLKAAAQRLVQLYEETHQPEQATKWKKKLAELETDKS